MKLSIDFWICMTGILAYIIISVIYIVRINKIKKLLREENKEISKPRYTMSLSLITAFVLEILPLLVPVATWVCAVVCACGVMGEYIVYQERAVTLMGK